MSVSLVKAPAPALLPGDVLATPELRKLAQSLKADRATARNAEGRATLTRDKITAVLTRQGAERIINQDGSVLLYLAAPEERVTVNVPKLITDHPRTFRRLREWGVIKVTRTRKLLLGKS